ncbi:saccharopine dehydrogenase-like NADP-dependent oxidoreductase [Fontibacillus phaseoli]|uniref:Saccharopine dehydrogenase-like NADP-dependent oxidoreductase n=1 Tax=Fontibacillus phaseoli TaxID=1416533 RepID=A0A369BQG2_9BACL|nr:saccharopine dehydrogenase NADP-binding domain-containing protein [Fontibacillus phaseoli]RCX22697.1 saccharopine dehydrogenase-like NADP-dependent oxidoreductase [Fontibacillus phaseoli]
MRDSILVIGGYGHVGKQISRELARLYPGKVLAAGRSLDKAEAFSRESNGSVLPMEIDIRVEPDHDMLARIKLVVMCLDQQDTAFVHSCLSQGIHYVDVSADYRFLSQVELLCSTAQSNRATAVLSVGLVPGLSNLMALRTKRLLDVAEEINISVMLGLGDSHGKAAIEWTIDQMNCDFGVLERGEPVKAFSFREGRKTDFGNGLGKRTAYRFNFADQHILPRTLQVPTVSTRLCFDSALATRMVSALKAMGALRILNLKQVRDFAVNRFASFKAGEPIFAVKVDAIGKKQKESTLAECFLYGLREAEATAKTAAVIAKALYASDHPHGVFHIEELFEFAAFEEALTGTAEMSERLVKLP